MAHVAQWVNFWLRSANNEGHFIWRKMYLRDWIWPAIRRIFLLNFTPINHSSCLTKYIRLLTIGQKWGVLNFENPTLHVRDLSETPQRRVDMQALQTMWVWLRSVYNIGHFTSSTMYLLRWISPDILGNFLQLHSWLASPLNNVSLVTIGQ